MAALVFSACGDDASERVATPEEIDDAIRGSMGLRMAAAGPLKINDFGGLDITTRVYQALVESMRSDHQVPAKIAQLVEEGNYGVKTGRGIYEYTDESIQADSTERDRRYLELVRLFYAEE